MKSYNYPEFVDYFGRDVKLNWSEEEVLNETPLPVKSNTLPKIILTLPDKDDTQKALKHIIARTIADVVYPVGSIYMSLNGTNPEYLFGGTWERIKHYFLLGAGDNSDTVNSTGGSSEASLPYHSHSTLDLAPFAGANEYCTVQPHQLIFATKHSTGGGLAVSLEALKEKGILTWGHDQSQKPDGSYGYAAHTSEAGDLKVGGKRDNMPPYLAVYMWQRIS